MSYYEKLRVDPKASKDQIKKAFRKAASAAHPDKHGGDHTEMAELNQIYSVLMDDELRAEYDTHGSVKRKTPLKDAAVQIIMQIFAKSLECGEHDPLDFTRKQLNHAIAQAMQQTSMITARVEKVKSKRGAMNAPDGASLFDSLVDQQVQGMTQQLESIKAQEAQFREALVVLKDYVSNVPPKPIVAPHYVYTTASTGGF